MNFNKTTLILPAVIVAITLAAVPAWAGQGNDRQDHRSTSERQASGRAAPATQAASDRRASPAPQAQARRADSAPSLAVQPQRQISPTRVAPQTSPYRQSVAPRVVQQQSVSRSVQGQIAQRPSYTSREVSRGVAVPRSSVGVRRYYEPRAVYRPYYSFQPRFRLGLGFYSGYPVAFPTWYDPYVSGAYLGYRSGIAYGGISLDIDPADAAVYVDGEYFGIVDDFAPDQAPLTLPAGRHHIELVSRGLQPMAFDLTVVPRQVIPYQGSLSR